VINVLELRSVWGTGGGPEKTILFGAARHDRTRFAVTVCYIRDDRDRVFGIDSRAGALSIDYVEVRERHSFDAEIWSALVSLVRTKRIDIIHGHDYKTNLLAWLLARKTGAIALATAHGWTGHSTRERWLYYPLDRFVLRHLPRVIAVSSEVRDTLVRSGANADRITVLLNGIDPSAFRRDDTTRDRLRRELGIGSDDVLIGAVGRLEPQKRFDLLLDAFATVRRAYPRTRLAIVGDGSLRSSLAETADRLGLADAGLFTGHRLDIADLHCAFDVFVQSSEYEGTPNAVLEAMAMETPLIATDAGGTRELAHDGVHGLIVPIGDVSALVRAMTTVLADPTAARARAAAARVRIEHELSFAERTCHLEAVYDELIAERDRQRASLHDSTTVGARRA
jgi:glycosyltransferase involved in cell wall biosynthesis